MKKTAMTLACLFLVLLLLPLFGSPARAMTSGDWEYTQLSGGKARIDKYTGDEDNVDIPSSIGGGYKVTELGNKAFAYKRMRTVTIPNTVTEIGSYAFQNCNKLEYVNGASYVTKIGDGAFSDCASLTNFEIRDGATKIGDYVFYNCSSLAALVIPASVQTITDGFYGCDALSIIYYGGSNGQWKAITMDEDSKAALDVCTIWYDTGDLIGTGLCGAQGDNLKWKLEYTDDYHLTISGSGAMADYSSSERVPWFIDAHKGLTYNDAIIGVTVSSGVTSIGAYAFYNHLRMVEITIPSTVKSIGDHAFTFCDCLASIVIPDGVTIIKENTFEGSMIQEITIPASVTSISKAAFYNCNALMDVYFGGTSAQWTTLLGNTSTMNDALRSATVHYKPTISQHPANASAALGGSATFKVTASSESPISYQWQYQKPGESAWNDVQSSGGTSASFTQTNIASRHNGYKFRCKVTNKAGTVTSNAATLTVSGGGSAPTITSQPSSVTVGLGATATFKVVASGSGLTYQWQYQKPGESAWNDVQASGGTSATFSQTNVASRHNGYKFRCKVTNGSGSVTSSAATLTVSGGGSAPTITSQPSSVTVGLGATATFKVVASGSGLSYQWQYQKPGESAWNDVQASGGTSATFSQTNVASRHNGYKFRCKVTNGSGSVTSNAATLTVSGSAAPTITSQPSSATVGLGATATFKVIASGSGLTYQWQYQKPGESTWNNCLDGGTSATFNQTNVAARHNGYKFRCKVTNGSGSVTSNAATLTVSGAPTITSQPASVTASLGSTATFKVVASGSGLSYQWQYQKPGESTWNDVQISGTSATFNQTNVAARHNGYKFRCKVTNSKGSIISNAATLTVS